MKFKEINSILSPKYHLPGSMAQRSVKKSQYLEQQVHNRGIVKSCVLPAKCLLFLC